MALGIGATAAIYSVLDAVVLRPLPYRDPGQLVAVLHPTSVPGQGESKWGMSAGGYFEFLKDSHSFSGLGGFTTSENVISGDGGDAQVVRTARITASIFTVLEARAYAGRLIMPTTTARSPTNRCAVVRVLAAALRRGPGVLAARSRPSTVRAR